MARIALTTGANSGIGLECVLELARRGYRSVGSVRSEACADVVGRFDLYALVNNAGYGLTGAVEDVDDDDARALLETMVVAPMRLARLALPAMRDAGEGRIVNISSIMGRTTTPLTGWYQGAKHALEALSDALRVEVAGAGVKVVLIEPGGFKTDIWADLERDVNERAGSRFGDAYRRGQTLTRLSEPMMGHPARVAKVVASAVAARRPRPRYLVGYDAQAIALADRLTPTAVKDAVTRIALGL